MGVELTEATLSGLGSVLDPADVGAEEHAVIAPGLDRDDEGFAGDVFGDEVRSQRPIAADVEAGEAGGQVGSLGVVARGEGDGSAGQRTRFVRPSHFRGREVAVVSPWYIEMDHFVTQTGSTARLITTLR